MFKTFGNLALASLLGMGALALPGGASAAIVPIVQQSAEAPSDSNILLQDVSHRRKVDRHWNWRHHGARCKTRFGNCRHYYRGYWYASPWWLISTPVIIIGGGSNHVTWCRNHYRSYNVRHNTWVDRGGRVRICISPF